VPGALWQIPARRCGDGEGVSGRYEAPSTSRRKGIPSALLPHKRQLKESPMDTPPMRSPPQSQLEDPLHEKEIFANEVAGIGSIHGNIAITFANIRFDDPVESNQPKARRVVAARLILTNPAAGQLLQSLQRLVAQIEAAQKSAAGKEPN
jgi:hypothetical protein